jgi:hypothetical protein
VNGACSICRFAVAFADVGLEPVILPASVPYWFSGGEDAWGRYLIETPHRIQEQRKAIADERVQCARFPGERPSMRKIDMCGEFQPLTQGTPL